MQRVAVGLALSVLVLGCSDEEPEPTDESPSVSETPTEPTTEPTSDPTTDASTEPTTEPTGPAEPTVTPAAGLLLEKGSAQLNAPVGDWERIPDIVKSQTAVGLGTTGEVISLSDRQTFEELSLDEQVESHNWTLPDDAIIRRQENVLLDGAPAYYVQWWVKGDTKIQHDIGTDRQGRMIGIQMDLNRSDPAASAALVASVLASFRWR